MTYLGFAYRLPSSPSFSSDPCLLLTTTDDDDSLASLSREQRQRKQWESGDVRLERWEVPALCTFLSEGYGSSERFTSLRLDGNKFSDTDCLQLAKTLNTNTNITSLSFNGCGLSPESLERLLAVIPHTKVTTLSLWGNDLSSCTSAVEQAIASSKFVSLNLGCCQLQGSAFCSILDAAEACQTLQTLDVSFNHVSDACATAIVHLLETSSHLTAIDARTAHATVSAPVERALAKEKRHSRQRRLRANGNPYHRTLNRKALAASRTFIKPLPAPPDHLNHQELQLDKWA